MSTKRTLAALLALPLLAMSSAADAGPHGGHERTDVQGIQGRQVEAPPWSFACMTDHGPSQCGEPMWLYGN